MYRYAQINDKGYVISDSHLSGEVNVNNMIPISNDFDLTNKKYEEGQWVDYTPIPDEGDVSEEEIQAQLLLNQTEIIAKQNEQDEVLAELLLNQIGGESNV